MAPGHEHTLVLQNSKRNLSPREKTTTIIAIAFLVVILAGRRQDIILILPQAAGVWQKRKNKPEPLPYDQCLTPIGFSGGEGR